MSGKMTAGGNQCIATSYTRNPDISGDMTASQQCNACTGLKTLFLSSCCSSLTLRPVRLCTTTRYLHSFYLHALPISHCMQWSLHTVLSTLRLFHCFLSCLTACIHTFPPLVYLYLWRALSTSDCHVLSQLVYPVTCGPRHRVTNYTTPRTDRHDAPLGLQRRCCLGTASFCDALCIPFRTCYARRFNVHQSQIKFHCTSETWFMKWEQGLRPNRYERLHHFLDCILTYTAHENTRLGSMYTGSITSRGSYRFRIINNRRRQGAEMCGYTRLDKERQETMIQS
jgi:hypothetical protein